MDSLLSWRSGLAASALVALTSCGGGEIIAVLGFIGSAGGGWLQDDKPAENSGQVGLQLRSNCGLGGADECNINIQPVNGPSLYSSDFDVTFTSNLPGCVASGTGRASGIRLTLVGCFSGEYLTINQALSDSGTIRMFFDFTPDLAGGVWVEIKDQQRRFAFNSNARGCELTAPTASPVAVALSPSDIRNPAGPFETTISAFVVSGSAAWQGRFVGVSGMRLTRGNEVLELERRQGTDTCPP